MSSKSGGSGYNGPNTITVSVLGVSGPEDVKGSIGVGKSLLCNRFVRGDYDNFFTEHSSILSQSDFGGSPVINSDHWLYWGEAFINNDELHTNIQIRVIEQTEFIDDENFDSFIGEGYTKRATKVKLESADKLMYICRDQLGLEAEFEQHILPEGRALVDGFVFVYDLSFVEDRSFEKQSEFALSILISAVKTKRPIVIAASKSDVADETGRKALQKLICRKELRSANLQIVEISSIANVNVNSVFTLVAALVEKWKFKPRIAAFADVAKAQKQREQEICDSYVSLLKKLIPIDCWPNSRPTWSKVLNRFGLGRHPDYVRFMCAFGIKKAKEYYCIHAEEAKKFWIQRRLQSEVLRLPKVFELFIGTEKLTSLTWCQAKNIILAHPFFNDYFLPVGNLSLDLDPSFPKMDLSLDDSRIFAEVLFIPEAESIFAKMQSTEEEKYSEAHMRTNLLNLLSACSQVTPGKPLKEADIFLRGQAEYDIVSPKLAEEIYSNYQEQLITRAQADFQELLLEQVQLFLTAVMKKRKKMRITQFSTTLTKKEIAELKAFLSDDVRYRLLNCLFEKRDEMIMNFASFISYPMSETCLSKTKCVESLLHEDFHSFLESRQMLDSIMILDIQVVTFGEKHLVSDFLSGAEKVMCGDLFESEKSLARITFVNENAAPFDSSTWIFLISSIESCEQARRKLYEILDMRCSPLIVLVADAVNFEMLPVLHKEGCALAKEYCGRFVGPGSGALCSDLLCTHTSENELNTFFTRGQMTRILDALFLSQITLPRLTARVQVSVMCSDDVSLDCFFGSLLSSVVHFVPYSSGGAVILDLNLPSSEQYARFELCISSYHSWFLPHKLPAFQGNILLYCAQRRASFAHMEAVLQNFIRMFPSMAVLIIAVVDSECELIENDVADLIERGRSLANDFGASFLVFSSNQSNINSEEEFTLFFDKVIPTCAEASPQKYHASADDISYTERSAVPYGMDDTVRSGWSNGSHGSNSSSQPSSEAPTIEAHDDIMKILRVPQLSFPSAGKKFLNDGIAPLATPEATESVSDVRFFKVGSSLPKKDSVDSACKLTHSASGIPFKNGSVASTMGRGKGIRGRHLQNIFISGDRKHPVPLGHLRNRPHSISAESLDTVGLNGSSTFYTHFNDSEASSSSETTKKSTKSRFVRKVTSSFRFRKNMQAASPKKLCDDDYDGGLLGARMLSASGSCSAPHSPQNERASRVSSKSKDVSSANEKNLNPFFWFQSRAPRRTAAKAAAENVCRTGVVLPSDTLESLASSSKDYVPIFVKMCIDYIEEEGGLEMEGIYRVPGNQAQVGELEYAFITDRISAFRSTKPPVNVAATALKNFFATLPEPLVPRDMYDQLVSCLDFDQSEALVQVGIKLKEWPLANQKTFACLGAHLARVARNAAFNAMDVRNLAKVWWPTLFRPDFDSFESMAVFVARLEMAAQLLLTYAVEQQH